MKKLDETQELEHEKTEYATSTDTTGCDYRDIADTLTLLGYPMNHSSARNYVMRGVEKIAAAVLASHDIKSEAAIVKRVARSARFQAGLAEILHAIQSEEEQRTCHAE